MSKSSDEVARRLTSIRADNGPMINMRKQEYFVIPEHMDRVEAVIVACGGIAHRSDISYILTKMLNCGCEYINKTELANALLALRYTGRIELVDEGFKYVPGAR